MVKSSFCGNAESRYVLKLLSCSAVYDKRSLPSQLTTLSGVSCSSSNDRQSLLTQLTTCSGVSCSTSYNKRSLHPQLTISSGVSCSTSYKKRSLFTRPTSFPYVSRITSSTTGPISHVTRVVYPRRSCYNSVYSMVYSHFRMSLAGTLGRDVKKQQTESYLVPHTEL